MNAGRELDALVAEKVMGLKPGVDFGAWPEHEWKRDEDGTVDVFGFDADTHNGPVCVRCGYGYCHHCQKEPSAPCEKRPRRYSTDIAAAWGVVERLAALGNHVAVESWRDSSDARWQVVVYDKHAYAPTAPLAICLAALKAVGAEAA